MAAKTTLQTICNKYCNKEFNEDNYSVGGGLDGVKFASNRHEDAKYDHGKLTLGEATQLFKKATGLEIDHVREVIEYAVPNMEWHHAGKLPKAYGGGMKKTYFINAKEICDIANNWNSYTEKLDLSKAAAQHAAEIKKNLEQRKHDFLTTNAKRFERSSTPSHPYYIVTAREMQGKYGWFDSTHKSYSLPEYFSGWEFETKEQYHEYLNIN
jgi:hypothetical protein